MTIPDVLIDTAIRAALQGGREILKVYDQADFGVEMKGDGSPLTMADQSAHHVIQSLLQNTGLPILSEEGATIDSAERRAWAQFWMVDPLDGTKEFIKRNGEFTVNIALIRSQEPVAGIIYVPVKQWLYVGVVGQGAWLQREVPATSEPPTWRDLQNRGLTLPRPQDARPFRVVGSRSHLSTETQDYVEELRKDHPDLEMVSMGSSLKLCLVADGSADVYPRFAPTMEWDTAAGDAIARAAGKSVTQWLPAPPEKPAVSHGGNKGEKVIYNKENLLNPWFIVD
ncbi:MAG: 3'(2'),5'-bisphosphate nucleotidase CysQ [Polyangiaceae bacterium]|nr:3'(2'),5'-bisphosphate nucleotidase CysQ [Polyangiaceae bacterium]